MATAGVEVAGGVREAAKAEAKVTEAVARATKKVEDEEKPVSARIHLDAWKRDLARKDGLGGLFKMKDGPCVASPLAA